MKAYKKTILGLTFLSLFSCTTDSLSKLESDFNIDFSVSLDITSYIEDFIPIIEIDKRDIAIGDSYNSTSKTFAKNDTPDGISIVEVNINTGTFNNQYAPEILSKNELTELLQIDIAPVDIQNIASLEINYDLNIELNENLTQLDYSNSITTFNKLLVNGVTTVTDNITNTLDEYYISSITNGLQLIYIEHFQIATNHPLGRTAIKDALQKRHSHYNGETTLSDDELLEIKNILQSDGIECKKILASTTDNSELTGIDSFESYNDFVKNDESKERHFKPIKVGLTKSNR